MEDVNCGNTMKHLHIFISFALSAYCALIEHLCVLPIVHIWLWYVGHFVCIYMAWSNFKDVSEYILLSYFGNVFFYQDWTNSVIQLTFNFCLD